jgi:hypothetical protein
MRKIELSENKENFGLTFSESKYKEFKETGNQNLFEEVIDSLMMNKYSDDVELNNYIKELPNDKKRIALLSTLDGNNNQWNNLKQLIDNKKSITDNIKEIILMLREFVKVGEVEKKKYGEVMTPLELVKDMLATLPKDVWSNPNLKWLDPANGTGPFPIMVIYKLMEGLKDWEPNEEKRYKHIIENMIYTCELQDRNVFLWLCAVDLEDKYVTNTYWGSFLEEGFDKHMKEVWNVEKFDIIMGNPPYNTGTKGGNGNRDLWDKFLFKSFDILVENGSMSMVHPSKWRSPENKIFDLFKENNLTFLEIHNDIDGKKVFGATTRYDFYHLQKSKYNGYTKVIDELGDEYNINILDWGWLPNYMFDEINKIINNNLEDNLDVVYSRSKYGNDKKWMSSEKTSEYKYSCVYGMYKDYTCSYKYSSIDKGHFGDSKVILGIGRYLYPKIDMEGKYGTMNNAFYIKTQTLEEAENIKKAIETDKFKEIIKATKWSNFQTSYKMFNSFKKYFWKEFIGQ